MTVALRTLRGTVGAFEGSYYRVTCPTAPAHLRELLLAPWQLRTAGAGDVVELSYRDIGTGCLWIVSEVITRAGGGQ